MDVTERVAGIDPQILAEIRAQASGVAIIVVGSVEQHGYYPDGRRFLPLNTDAIIATAHARRQAATFGFRMGARIPVSCSQEHSAWPETRSISPVELWDAVTAHAKRLHAQGYGRIVLWNCHGGNYLLRNLVQVANSPASGLPKMLLLPDRDDNESARRAARLATTSHQDMHAGEEETSKLLYLQRTGAAEQLTYTGTRKRGLVHGPWRSGILDHVVEDRNILTDGVAAYAPHGVLGRPSKATAEKGQIMFDSVAATTSRRVANFLTADSRLSSWPGLPAHAVRSSRPLSSGR